MSGYYVLRVVQELYMISHSTSQQTLRTLPPLGVTFDK